MAELKKIPTYTVVTSTIPDVDVSVNYLNSCLGDIFNVFLNEEYKLINGTPFLQGHGVVTGSSLIPSMLDLFVEIDGHLILLGDVTEIAMYSIDSNGHLIYTNGGC